jgi:hypothetical protein
MSPLEVLEYLESQNLPERQGWFYHGMRDIILRLMTNSACSDTYATKLNSMLAIVNQLQRERSLLPEEPNGESDT